MIILLIQRGGGEVSNSIYKKPTSGSISMHFVALAGGGLFNI
jgi:hypothetical protein